VSVGSDWLTYDDISAGEAEAQAAHALGVEIIVHLDIHAVLPDARDVLMPFEIHTRRRAELIWRGREWGRHQRVALAPETLVPSLNERSIVRLRAELLDVGPMSVVEMPATRLRSSMLNQSAETEKPLIALGDQTTQAVQLRDWAGISLGWSRTANDTDATPCRVERIAAAVIAVDIDRRGEARRSPDRRVEEGRRAERLDHVPRKASSSLTGASGPNTSARRMPTLALIVVAHRRRQLKEMEALTCCLPPNTGMRVSA